MLIAIFDHNERLEGENALYSQSREGKNRSSLQFYMLYKPIDLL